MSQSQKYSEIFGEGVSHCPECKGKDTEGCSTCEYSNEDINYEFPVRDVCAGCEYVEDVKKHGDHPACDSCVHAEEVDHRQMYEPATDPDLPF